MEASQQTPPSRRQAIFVAHGIGQQYPFRVLDSFSQGLHNLLRARGYTVSLSHRTLGAGRPFDHSITIEATLQESNGAGPGDRPPKLSIDVYEYW